jgi:hypothetical protein
MLSAPPSEDLFRILSAQSRSDCHHAIFLVETIELSGNSAIFTLSNQAGMRSGGLKIIFCDRVGRKSADLSQRRNADNG